MSFNFHGVGSVAFRALLFEASTMLNTNTIELVVRKVMTSREETIRGRHRNISPLIVHDKVRATGRVFGRHGFQRALNAFRRASAVRALEVHETFKRCRA